MILLAEGGPLFSRADDCVGCVAAFGPKNTRSVLTNIGQYGMPIPLAHRFAFPTILVNLNSGLFSMTGEEHRAHQQLLGNLLNIKAIELSRDAISVGCSRFLESWRAASVIPLLSEMRRMVLHVSSRVMFGSETEEPLKLGQLIQNYFQLRRAFTTNVRSSSQDEDERERLIELGLNLDTRLRNRVRHVSKEGSDYTDGLLGRLCGLKLSSGEKLSEQQLVTHANVLFMSSSEPTAVALTWTLLLLSQLPELRILLKRELDSVCGLQLIPSDEHIPRLKTMDYVIKESLRLLPPNAIMIRLTNRTVELDGFMLPERCEVLLSPYVSHRDHERFSRPDYFMPSRWEELSPGPFEYLPFGTGQRYCIGRHLANYMLIIMLSTILRRFDLVLAEDQHLDWLVNVNLMPASEPMILISKEISSNGGRLRGPVAELVRFACLDA